MNDSQPIRIGTRGSLLARTQAGIIHNQLLPLAAGRPVELVIISTSGDQLANQSLAQIGGKGLFVKEIEAALLAGQIDLAVHSAKDVPVEIPNGLSLSATPPREAPNDVWIGHAGQSIQNLPPGAVVGSSSLRRQSQLLMLRPDLQVQPLRGNIDTRLKKVREGVIAGTVLALSGLRRAGLLPEDATILPEDEFIPAAGQGTLVLETRTDNAAIRSLINQIHDVQSAAALAFERGIVRKLAGDCLAPIGVCAMPRTAAGRNGWIVRAIAARPDGKASARATLLTDDPSINGLNALYQPLLEALESRGVKDILGTAGTHGGT